MYKKFNLKILIIIFIILLAIVSIIKLIDNKRGDRTFSSELIDVDTSLITSVKFYPKAEKFKEISLERKNKIWKLVFDKKTYNADMSMVKSVINEIGNLKSDHIAATERSKWKDFEVTDNDGVKVKVYQKGTAVAEFVVGKFAYQKPASPNPYQQQGSISTYVRLMNDDKVYAVNGYMNILFNRNAFSYKNKTIINMEPSIITKLSYIYPGDSSFFLSKMNDKWSINTTAVDSAFTISFINSISHLSSEDFLENINSKSLPKPLYELNIEGKNFPHIELKVYTVATIDKYIITTSLNEGQYFSGTKNNLFNKIFVSKNKFVKN